MKKRYIIYINNHLSRKN